jgi:hypothetical protein
MENIMIDYKSGKVTWDTSYNWERDNYDHEQDILQISYGENCVIDVGSYTNSYNESRFVIKVIDFSPYPDDNDKPEAWRQPFASIPCVDKADMLVQLQRAIDIYPNMIG